MEGSLTLLTRGHLREACALLRWTRYDLQRTTASPFDVVDRMLRQQDVIVTTLAREIVVKHALHRAGIELTADRPRLRRTRSHEL